MPDDDELDRKVRKLAVDHAVVHNTQDEHTARFDSIDSQLHSLTQLVGRVLERLPEEPDNSSS